MSLQNIPSDNLKEEQNIQEAIFNAIDQNENIIFSAGAGAGKTHTLIESLKYIVKNHGQRLRKHNQQIVCITYTNVATEKVREQLGNSRLVKVSTIHQRIWELIESHQKELLKIHVDKLNGEIITLKSELTNNNKFQKFQNLSPDQQESLTKLMIEEKELFYTNQDKKANDFREIFKDMLEEYPDILRNYTHFKSLVSKLYKLNNYSKCLRKIGNKNPDFQKIEYNATYNTDRLHRMRISHDTLLEYGLTIIKQYKLLQQIIINKYPYFLVDEYQDTNEKVVQVIALLSQYSTEINHPFFVGYFGDAAQNIYEHGIGKKIHEIHPQFQTIKKDFNRRSNEEIIAVINRVRADEIIQQSIYDDCSGGSVKFYTGSENQVNDFIEEYTTNWEISSENKLHCFTLTNKSVAEYSGFSEIYSFFQGTSKYKTNYNQLTTEVLSQDPTKLGEIPAFLIRLIGLKNGLLLENTPVQNVLNKDIYSSMNIQDLRDFIDTLKAMESTTLIELINNLRHLYPTPTHNKEEKVRYKKFVDFFLDYEGFPTKSIIDYLMESLYPNLEEEIPQTQQVITDFLNKDLTQFNLWYQYIMGESNSSIVYHTYHGTKGLEFDNVIILMENAFGKTRNYFNKYFTALNDTRALPNDLEQQKNLFYVACSRAIKNLRIFYLDDIEEFKTGIQTIFETIEEYPNKPES
ncbi:MAG: UvrD-helicase domain-containing protein [Aureispira sp.]